MFISYSVQPAPNLGTAPYQLRLFFPFSRSWYGSDRALIGSCSKPGVNMSHLLPCYSFASPSPITAITSVINYTAMVIQNRLVIRIQHIIATCAATAITSVINSTEIDIQN